MGFKDFLNKWKLFRHTIHRRVILSMVISPEKNELQTNNADQKPNFEVQIY